MPYRWGDFYFDHDSALLTRCGRSVDVSRKVRHCLQHLIEHRDRAVNYDELIRALWGHDNVTNHQLTQIVVAARRAIGDDGQAQTAIRTISGIGYRWVAKVSESEPDRSESSESAQEPAAKATAHEEAPKSPALAATVGVAAPTPPETPITARGFGSRFRLSLIVATAFALVITIAYGTIRRLDGDEPRHPSAATQNDLDTINTAILQGKYDDARERLSKLPPSLAETPRAALLEIKLDVDRGREDTAIDKIEALQARVEATKDRLLMAEFLTTKSYVLPTKQAQASLGHAESALSLLEPLGTSAPPALLSDALSARASAYYNLHQYDEAVRDLVRSRDIKLKAGNKLGASINQSNLARIWMRQGRLIEALDEVEDSLNGFDPTGHPVHRVATINTITRIQAELLRVDDALKGNDEAMRLLRSAPDSSRRSRTMQLRVFILSNKGRLREAAKLIEEIQHLDNAFNEGDSTISAFFDIESGNPTNALTKLQKTFTDRKYKSLEFNPMLEDADGPLLLWTIAAHDLARQEGTVPTLLETQAARILNPKTATGLIAYGRWLWTQGKYEEAEAKLRTALAETRRSGHTLRARMAAEALIEMLIERDQLLRAQTELETLRAYHSNDLREDYRTSVLDLRLALALRDADRIRKAYERARKLAGERPLPIDLAKRYAAWAESAKSPESVNAGLRSGAGSIRVK